MSILTPLSEAEMLLDLWKWNTSRRLLYRRIRALKSVKCNKTLISVQVYSFWYIFFFFQSNRPLLDALRVCSKISDQLPVLNRLFDIFAVSKFGYGVMVRYQNLTQKPELFRVPWARARCTPWTPLSQALGAYTLFCTSHGSSPPTRVTATGLDRGVPRLAPVGWVGLAPATELPLRGWGDVVDVLRYNTVLF